MKQMQQKGFSLMELVITITVLTILTMGVMPLVKVSVKRQKEQQLRETLRQMRMAIDDFHRDTVGMVCSGVALTPQQQAQQQQGGGFLDPRSKVVISDCTIFYHLPQKRLSEYSADRKEEKTLPPRLTLLRVRALAFFGLDQAGPGSRDRLVEAVAQHFA